MKRLIVICLEKLIIKSASEKNDYIFREGEKYIANQVNDHYWVVDSVGVRVEDFALHFEIIDEIEEESSGDTVETASSKFVEEEREFKKFLENFGFGKAYEDKVDSDKDPWYIRYTKWFIQWG